MKKTVILAAAICLFSVSASYAQDGTPKPEQKKERGSRGGFDRMKMYEDLNLSKEQSDSIKKIDELRRRYDEIGMEAIAKMRNAQADKSAIGILGDDWTKQQQFDILKSIASNESGGGIASAGAGLGMGLAAGGMFGNMVQQTFNQSRQPTNANPVESIKQLKELFDIGAITQEEFDTKKKEILSKM